MVLRITEVSRSEPYTLHLVFNDGVRKSVNLRLLFGAVFEPLLAPDFFARVVLDPCCGTVVWPNGADFAPEALYELPALVQAPVVDVLQPNKANGRMTNR